MKYISILFFIMPVTLFAQLYTPTGDVAQTNTGFTRIGIGTATPQQGLLEINGDGASNGITLWTNSGESTSRIWGNASQNLLHITRGAQPTNGLTLTAEGKLGIGSTSPQQKLEVYDGRMRINSNAPVIELYERENDKLWFLVMDGNRLGFRKNTTTLSEEVFSLGADGNVGVGVTYPGMKLDVEGDIRLRGDLSTLYFRRTTSPADIARIQYDQANSRFCIDANNKDVVFQNRLDFVESMRVTASGNVGIGSSSPDSKLEISVNAVGGAQLHINNDNAAGRADLILQEGNSTKGVLQYRGTTNPTFPNAVRLMTHTGTNADIFMGTNGGHQFFISGGQNGVTQGYIGIGTSTPTEKLTVKGTVHAEEVKVELLPGSGPDYVFEDDYQLPSLEEVKRYIGEHKHLPEVPSAKEMEEDGVKVGEMNMILLKKVEELTLYIISQEQAIKAMEESYESRIEALEARLEEIAERLNGEEEKR